MNSALIKVLCLTSTIVLSSISSAQAQPTNQSEIREPDKPLRLEPLQCLQCEVKYEDSLRKKAIEGSVTVIINVDKNGEVQLVRLGQSSGNIELDEAAITQAFAWKFKPSTTERQNQQIRINYVIAGSRRHRLLTRSRSEPARRINKYPNH